MRFLILGHARHGKDTVAEIMRDKFNLTFTSSSFAAAEIAVRPFLSKGYATLADCYADRVNCREEWRQLITAYNTPDKSKLCREILERTDIYVGMRCPEEYAASKNLFDVVLWVDRAAKLPSDPTMQIEFDHNEMIYIGNNGQIAGLMQVIGSRLYFLTKRYKLKNAN
jgi:hypothetical protein